jgi:hypothetical protein
MFTLCKKDKMSIHGPTSFTVAWVPPVLHDSWKARLGRLDSEHSDPWSRLPPPNIIANAKRDNYRNRWCILLNIIQLDI